MITLKAGETPIFLDFEASSLDLVSSFPIEVGLCLPNGDPISWLIKPHVLWRDWSEQSEEIHGISRATLVEEGHSLVDVAHWLNEYIPDYVFCDAWTFDYFWLHRLYRAAKLEPTFALESISMLLDANQVQQWQATRQKVIHELDIQTHRAANDALILHRTYKALTCSE